MLSTNERKTCVTCGFWRGHGLRRWCLILGERTWSCDSCGRWAPRPRQAESLEGGASVM